jgi:hypothetical protein
MKTLVIILSAIGLLSLNSCKQESDPQALMKNSEARTEVFNAITGNHDYMTEFMANMHNSDHAKQMMQGEGMQMMMKNMMGNKQMMHSMMKGMMSDGKMMGTMVKMMHEKGMMSEDCMKSCMKSCMKMMSEKGMNMNKSKMIN